MFPATLKSAVESSGTIIFIPSYFDFVRVQNWLSKQGTSCAFISEYVQYRLGVWGQREGHSKSNFSVKQIFVKPRHISSTTSLLLRVEIILGYIREVLFLPKVRVHCAFVFKTRSTHIGSCLPNPKISASRCPQCHLLRPAGPSSVLR